MARRKGAEDECVIQNMLNDIGRIGLTRTELKIDQEPSKFEIARVLASRCKTTVLTESAAPRGSNGSLGRGEPAYLSVQGQLRALRAPMMNNFQTDVGAGHRQVA